MIQKNIQTKEKRLCAKVSVCAYLTAIPLWKAQSIMANNYKSLKIYLFLSF